MFWDVGEALALVIVPRRFADIFLHRRPEIALLERFECEGDPYRVVPADAFMYVTEDLGRLDTIETPEQRR